MKPILISPLPEDLLPPHAVADSANAAPAATTPVTLMNLRRKVANLSSQIRHGSGNGRSPAVFGLSGVNERTLTTGSTCTTPATLRRSALFGDRSPRVTPSLPPRAETGSNLAD